MSRELFFDIILFACTIDPKAMDKNGETVLHWACKSNTENDEMVEMLLAKYVTKRTQTL